MFKGYPVIDLHCHLRNDIPGHTKTARENGIDAVVYMANCNPPLAEKKDVLAIKEGLEDGTIDAIASDYAPLPRKTGIAGFKSFIPLSYGLVLEGVLSETALKEKLFINPKKIIEGGGYKLNFRLQPTHHPTRKKT